MRSSRAPAAMIVRRAAPRGRLQHTHG